jgi:putative FmdB family regulatory protein
MPIYEYHCKDCGHHFEVLQKISVTLIPSCEQCQGQHVDRWVSAAGFQLKGTGWYATDFKNAAPAPAAKTEAIAAEAPKQLETTA